jgi:hypothetical protein
VRHHEGRQWCTTVTRPSSVEGQGAHPPSRLGLDPEQCTRTGASSEIRCRTSVLSSNPPFLRPDRHSTLKCAFARGRNTYSSIGERNPCDPIRSTRIITSATRGNSCSKIGAAFFRWDSAARSGVMKFSGPTWKSPPRNPAPRLRCASLPGCVRPGAVTRVVVVFSKSTRPLPRSRKRPFAVISRPFRIGRRAARAMGLKVPQDLLCADEVIRGNNLAAEPHRSGERSVGNRSFFDLSQTACLPLAGY